PEQLSAGDADARADQFSFCVALYEALYRTRPFAGDTVAELIDEIRAGRVRAMAPTTPPWLRSTLARGLATDPAARFGAMDALLDALSASQANDHAGPIQVLVADFDNTTGEPLFDGALEITVAIMLEEAPLISAYPRGSTHKALAELGAPRLDEAAARQIAARERIEAVVSGTIGTTATGFAISLRAVDSASGQDIARAECHVANKRDC